LQGRVVGRPRGGNGGAGGRARVGGVLQCGRVEEGAEVAVLRGEGGGRGGFGGVHVFPQLGQTKGSKGEE